MIPLVCAGCGTTATTTPEPEPLSERYVGQTFWTDPRHPVSICDGLAGGTAQVHCDRLPDGMALIIEETIYRRSYGVRTTEGYRVTTGREKPGYISDNAMIYLMSDAEKKAKDKEKADCDRRGGIRIGMTREQVYASCWGKPRTINETVTAGGRQEQLVYGGGYIYLENGIVSSMQVSH